MRHSSASPCIDLHQSFSTTCAQTLLRNFDLRFCSFKVPPFQYLVQLSARFVGLVPGFDHRQRAMLLSSYRDRPVGPAHWVFRLPCVVLTT